MTLHRQISLHCEESDRPLHVRASEGTAWIFVEVSETERITVFLSAAQLREFGAACVATADAMAPDHPTLPLEEVA
jgi:hypothetical protein